MRDVRPMLNEAGFPAQTEVFLEWAWSQHPSVLLRVLAYSDVIARSQGCLLDLPVGVPIPNVWVASDAAAHLRDLAASAGFLEVASIFEQTYQEAAGLIQQLESAPYPG